MYLVDTDVLSELRKHAKANAGVRRFVADAVAGDTPLYLSAISIGELRRGVELIRHRNDASQARRLEAWLDALCAEFATEIIAVDEQVAQIWGKLRAPNPENTIDKQIAATALLHDLTVVTRNTRHFAATGVRCLNPFN